MSTPNIQSCERELVARETAAQRLTGIPALQNQSAIDRLYDTLTALHIDELEAADAPLGECTYCGAEYYDDGERAYHGDAECIGGDFRFTVRS